MDNNGENSINSPNNTKVNKRRSLVFKRQSIVPKEQDLELVNTTEEIVQESKKFKSHEKSESFNILKYIESLKEEDKKWREEYAKRKSRVQDLVKQDKIQERIGQTLDITCLSDSERAFLEAKPNYEEFNRNLSQLHAMAIKVSFLNACSEKFYNSATSKLQNNTKNAEIRIINLTD